MGNKGLFKKMMDFIADLGTKDGFQKLDFGVLKTLMLLGSVDGDLSADEIGLFKQLASKCKGYGEESFASLWKDALHSAGYILLLTHIGSSKDEIVAAFLDETAVDFTELLAQETNADRNRVFETLETMAKADGDYSEIERACVAALAERVQAARLAAIQARYPRAASYDNK